MSDGQRMIHPRHLSGAYRQASFPGRYQRRTQAADGIFPPSASGDEVVLAVLQGFNGKQCLAGHAIDPELR